MVLVRVLQRKDAASLVVAIAAGLAVYTFVSSITGQLAAMLSGIEVETSFAEDYWHPLVALVLQLLALEILARIVIATKGSAGK